MKNSLPTKRIHTRTDELRIPDSLIQLWILRLLVPLGGYREFLTGYGFGDDALANYLGIVEPDCKYQTRTLLAGLRKRYQQAENKRSPKMLSSLLDANIDRIGHLLSLDETAKAILAFAVLLQLDPWLQRAAHQIGSIDASRLMDVLTGVLQLDRSDVRRTMSPRGPLHESGLLRLVPRFGAELADRLALLSDGMADRMLHTEADPINLLSDIFTPDVPPSLTLSDYGHIRSIEVLLPYLRHALDTARPGVNVLIHGVPGTGKTQLTRVVAQSLACDLFVLTAQCPTGDSIDAESRLRVYRVAQGMLKQRRALILFDEIEDVFNDGWTGLGGKSTAQSRKAWMNRALESNPVPNFWLTNSVGSLDPAFVRRFDVVIEAELPTGQARRTLVERACGSFIDPLAVARLLESPQLAPAVVERAAGVVSAVRSEFTAARASQAMVQLIDSTLVAQGHGPLAPAGQAMLSCGYDPHAINTDTDLDVVTKGLLSARAGRLYLYGPPGTGKTAYGHWLAQQLDRPLHVKRVSDIVRPYLGETEQNLARVFRQAGNEKAILLIDEVDGFLRDRRQAQRSWEITAVNEMLVQMEMFDGVFIASTNLMDDIDQAALRRFDLKVKFDYLGIEQAKRLLMSTAEALGIAAPTARDLDLLRSLRTLTPGDFAAIERQHRFRPLADAAQMVAALAAECALKKASASRPIGFVGGS